MDLKIYGNDSNPRTQLLLIVAELEGIQLQRIEVVPRLEIGKAEYMAKFPMSMGKIPALEGPRVKLIETVAIAVYLAKVHNKLKLLGDGSLEQESQVLSYLSWANQELLVILATWYLPLIPGFTDPPPYNEAAVVAGKAKSQKLLTFVEGHLDDRDWLVGSHMTLADVMLAVYVSRGLGWVLGASWRAAHPNTMKHFHAVMGQAAVKKAIPNPVMIEEEPPIKDPYEGPR